MTVPYDKGVIFYDPGEHIIRINEGMDDLIRRLEAAANSCSPTALLSQHPLQALI